MESKIPASDATLESSDDLELRIRLAAKTIGGLSELARRADIPLRSLNLYLAGTTMPGYRIAAVARATGTSADWLLGDAPKTKRDRELEEERLRRIIEELEEGPQTPATAEKIARFKTGLQLLQNHGASSAERAEPRAGHRNEPVLLDRSLLLACLTRFFKVVDRLPTEEAADKARLFVASYEDFLAERTSDTSLTDRERQS